MDHDAQRKMDERHDPKSLDYPPLVPRCEQAVLAPQSLEAPILFQAPALPVTTAAKIFTTVLARSYEPVVTTVATEGGWNKGRERIT